MPTPILTERTHMTRELLQQALDALNDATPAVRCPTCNGDDQQAPCAYPEGGQPGCLRDKRLSAAPAVREPIIDEMDAVASKYAHKLALDLECVLSDYNGKWWDTAMNTIGEYRMAMNRIHERESPTHMGEPVIAARKDAR